MVEITLFLGISLGVIALFAEYIDSTLGMGYGTLLTPILMLIGFEPLQVVPAVLVSEAVTGITAGIMHHTFGNVRFSITTGRGRGSGVLTMVRTALSTDLKIMLLIASCSIVGTVSAVLIATSIKTIWLSIYIGILILSIGLFILLTANKTFRFSWKKITLLGLVASFNKGMSGGGYGPLVTGGQILSGVSNKSAIGITSFAEGLTCVVGVVLYWIAKERLDLRILPYILAGALLSVPFSTITVRRMSTKRLRFIIGLVTFCIGVFALTKLFL